jgi:hypothetical protein
MAEIDCPPATQWARYCIEWTSNGSVTFSVDGKVLDRKDKTTSIGEAWLPMYGYFSIWGSAHDDVKNWSGSVRGMTEDAFGFIRNVTFTAIT